MSTNKMLIAGLIGGLAAFLTGFLLYGLLLPGFFEAHSTAPEGTYRADTEMIWWALIAGNLSTGFLYAFIFGRWTNISTFMTGLKAGAMIGLLFAFSFDMLVFATANLMDLTGTLVDVVVMGAIAAVAGGVVGWWYGRS